jgi:membrane protease YdiL (CAAX protease family)
VGNVTVSNLIQHIVAILLLVAVPVWDRLETRRLKQSTDPRAKLQSYRRIVGMLWLLTAVLLLAVPFQQLVRPPLLSGTAAKLVAQADGAWPVLLGLLVGMAMPVFLARMKPRAAKQVTSPLQALSWFLPRTSPERRWFVAVCFSAGICEEIIYRGFLIRYLMTLPFLGSVLASVVVAALLFALGHTYQGWLGALSVTILALVFTALFFVTHSLWLPMVLHVLVDLRILLLWRGDHEPSETASTGAA